MKSLNNLIRKIKEASNNGKDENAIGIINKIFLMINSIKIGTRSSNLAMYQPNLVKGKLTEIFPNIKYSIVKIKTKGDKFKTRI